jgi:hypothetical protein
MKYGSWLRMAGIGLSAALFAFPFNIALSGQQADPGVVIQRVDAAVKDRVDHVADYTVTEHYAVFRNHDETNPAAEMLVKTVYKKGAGKNYTILSQSGSAFLRREVLGTLLENERQINLPGNVENALITSHNYQMEPEPNGQKQLDGRDCVVIKLIPRRSSPYLFKGTLWVDAKEFKIMQLQGTAAKSPYFFLSAANVARQYTNVNGYPMATHARAVSNSSLFGQTVVKIDYSDYNLDLVPAMASH